MIYRLFSTLHMLFHGGQSINQRPWLFFNDDQDDAYILRYTHAKLFTKLGRYPLRLSTFQPR